MDDKARQKLQKRRSYRYFRRLSEKKQPPVDEFYILTPEERQAMRKVKYRAMMLAGLTGALAVGVYYAPLLLFADFFKQFIIHISPFGLGFDFNWVTTAWSLALVFTEVAILTRINIWGVAETANACKFPDKKDVQFELHLEQLFNLGQDAPNKETLKFGIDPYAGLPRFYIFLFTLWNIFKATLTNFLVKTIVVKIVGRAELRQYADLAGVPLFALWNAFATRRIIENARIYIMAPGVINQLNASLSHLKEDEDFRQNVFDTLQYIVSVKRSFHHNHYLLVKRLIELFDLQNFQDKEPDPEAFLDKIRDEEEDVKMAYSKLIILGIILDGWVSFRERKILTGLYEKKILLLNPVEVRQWARKFRRGEGLDEFIRK